MNTVYIALGWFSLFLGFIGIFLPLLPTTPFVLLAAFFFSKGSKDLHQWLLNNRRFGPMIRNWQEHGAISKRAKTMSISMMTVCAMYTLTLNRIPFWGKVGQAVCLIGVGIYVLTRPHGAKKAKPAIAEKTQIYPEHVLRIES